MGAPSLSCQEDENHREKNNMASSVHPDLERERRQATFDPVDLTYVLDGGKEKTERRRYVRKYSAGNQVCTVAGSRAYAGYGALRQSPAHFVDSDWVSGSTIE